MGKKRKFEIATFDQLINAANAENVDRVATDLALWLKQVIQMFSQMKLKHPQLKDVPNSQIAKVKFNWIDDGIIGCTSTVIRDELTGEVHTKKIDQSEKTELFYIIGFLKEKNMLKMSKIEQMFGAYVINQKSPIDNRKIKSATPGSLSGLNYDSNGDNEHVLLLTDRNGNEHPMKLDKNNTKQLIQYLQSLQFE